MDRLKTKSKHFYDDEILGVMENGDIVLKQGVIRIPKYRFNVDSSSEESYYNSISYTRDKADKIRRSIDEESNWD